DLVAARRPLLFFHQADDLDRRLLAGFIERHPRALAGRGFGHHRLRETGAVAQDQELQFPAAPLVVDPARHFDRFSDMRFEVLDAGGRGHASSSMWRLRTDAREASSGWRRRLPLTCASVPGM